MSKIEAFSTTPLTNYARYHFALTDDYSAWMWAASSTEESAVATAKRVLGRQDYCWVGSARNWIWERPAEITLADGTVVTRHWRLFASRKGFTLEIETGGDPWGEMTQQAASRLWNAFLAEWRDNDDNWDQSGWDMVMETRSR
tara:strand:- start:82 stop:510 length:429 start_codon:yes stop_codon:yes gene_type:complete